MIEHAQSLYVAVGGVVLLVAGIDVGIAFLMRAQREATPDD